MYKKLTFTKNKPLARLPFRTLTYHWSFFRNLGFDEPHLKNQYYTRHNLKGIQKLSWISFNLVDSVVFD